jgi:hypothetical protein
MSQAALVCGNGAGASSCPTAPSYVAEDGRLCQTPAPAQTVPKGKGRAALLWGVGSTLLSLLGFVAWAMFEQYNNSLSELRSDLKHFNETSSSFVKRDTLQRFREKAQERFKELQSVSVLREHLEKELKTSERAREEMAHELQQLRERLAFVEGQHSMAPNLQRPSPGKNEVTRNEKAMGLSP